MLTESQISEKSKITETRYADGPRGNPIWGVLLERRRDPFGFFSRVFREYGDMARFRAGPFRVNLISHPDMIKQMLFDNEEHFRKGKIYDSLRVLLGSGLLNAEGEKWRFQRKLAQPLFHQKNLMPLIQTMSESTNKWLGQVSNDRVVDINKEMMTLTLDIVIKTLFGAAVAKEDIESIGQNLTVALHCVNDIFQALIPLPPSFPSLKARRLRNATRGMEKVVYKIIEHRRINPSTGSDLLTALMSAKDQETGEALSDLQLRDEMMTFLLAGHETTANSLTWTLYLLSQNPETFMRLKKEVDEVLGGNAVTHENIGRLKYTLAILEEGMRLYPPVYFIVRNVVKDTVVGNFKVSKGDLIGFSTYIVQKDPRWWPEPERFVPDRFLEGSTWNNSKTRPKFSYIPFSAGPRNCIGAPFALLEGTLILATLAQKFRFETLAGFVPEPQAVVTVRPKHGMLMRAVSLSH